jgi:hypothetical protein
MEKFYKRSMGLMLLMLLAATIAFAQTTVSGTVKDEAGSPIPGINIKVKGSVAGTISDVRGNFTVTTSQAPPITLEFSFIGYTSQEIEITDATTTGLNVTMVENI